MTKEEFDTADNAKLDNIVVKLDRRANYKGFPFRLADQFGRAIAKRHIIKGIFARGETSAWIAPPGGMKSALMAEASVHIAAGMDWHGRRNKERCGVVYFALERADLVERRIRAHTTRLNLQSLPIAIVSATIDLMNPNAVPRIVETIQEAEACFGLPAGFAVFDTFAKLIAAGGGDENSAKDQGRVFANIQRIKDVIDIHPALVGHTGKDTSKGWRGSNAGIGDADMVVEVSGDTIKTATVTKANDAPEGVLFSFKSETYDFGTDEDGEPITVNIVSPEELSLQVATKPREPKLTDNQEAMLRLLRDAGLAGLTGDDWNAKARAEGIGLTRRSTLVNLKGQLKDKGLVREYMGIWHVQR
jgi:AAA domain-containing protein